MGQVDKKKTEQVVESMRSAFGMTKSMGATKGVIPNMVGSPIPMLPLPQISSGKKGDDRHAKRNDLAKVKAELDSFLAGIQASDKVRLALDRRGLVISLTATNFFSSGSADINPEVYPLLNQVAESLVIYDNAIRIEGYTDNAPIRSSRFPSNWELSSARALSLLHYLIERQGFAPSRLSATGFGEQHPVADNATEEGRMLNRRVDLVVLLNDREESLF